MISLRNTSIGPFGSESDHQEIGINGRKHYMLPSNLLALWVSCLISHCAQLSHPPTPSSSFSGCKFREHRRLIDHLPLSAPSFDFISPPSLQFVRDIPIRSSSSPHPVQSLGKPAETVRTESGGWVFSKENIAAGLPLPRHLAATPRAYLTCRH